MADMIIYGSLLILFIIIIRPAALKRLPKDIFIFLWIVAMVRLLIPFDFPELINIYPAVNIQPVNNVSDIQRIIPVSISEFLELSQPVINNGISDKAAAVPAYISPKMIIAVIWIAGSIITFAALVIPHIINMKRYKSALPIENEFISEWKLQHILRRKYDIVYSDEVTTPFIYGLVKSIIVLPESIIDSDTKTLDYVLTHEFTHIKYFDVVKKWLMLVTLCVHWFNPLVWLMRNLMNGDIEIACDEKVIKSKGITNKVYYASILVDLASAKSKYNALASNFNYNIIKKRVGLIMKTSKITIRQILSCLLIITFTLLINVTNYAEISKAAELLTEEPKETDVIVNVVNPYENARFGDTRDTLLLEVELYTYETYREDMCIPLIEARQGIEPSPDEKIYYYNGYGGNILTTNDPVEAEENMALLIKYKKIIVARTINGKPAKDLGFPIKWLVTNNGDGVLAEKLAGYYDENGYYKFNITYDPYVSFTYNSVNGESLSERFILDDSLYYEFEYGDHIYGAYRAPENQEEYQKLLNKNFNPKCRELYKKGLMDEDIYNFYMESDYIQAPRDYYVNMFFS